MKTLLRLVSLELQPHPKSETIMVLSTHIGNYIILRYNNLHHRSASLLKQLAAAKTA